MILGIGTDLANIERIQGSIERFGDRFTHRLFTPAERAYAARRQSQASTFAKRFAAKEACLKALGTGLIRGFAWHDMEILNDAAGCPTITLRGRALQRLDQITPPGHGAHLHLSLTDDPPWAQAFVIVEARPAAAAGPASP